MPKGCLLKVLLRKHPFDRLVSRRAPLKSANCTQGFHTWPIPFRRTAICVFKDKKVPQP
jgi:hypothetical protein